MKGRLKVTARGLEATVNDILGLGVPQVLFTNLLPKSQLLSWCWWRYNFLKVWFDDHGQLYDWKFMNALRDLVPWVCHSCDSVSHFINCGSLALQTGYSIWHRLLKKCLFNENEVSSWSLLKTGRMTHSKPSFHKLYHFRGDILSDFYVWFSATPNTTVFSLSLIMHVNKVRM